MEGKSYYLTPYFIRSITGHSLDSIKGQYDLLLELYEELSVLKESQEVLNFEDNRRVLKVRDVIVDEDERLVYGILEYGEYGEELKVINTETGDITHQVDPKEAVTKPFYFCFYIPNDSEKGILLSQKTGNIGIKSVIYDFCKEKFYSKFPLYFPQLILKEVLDNILSQPLTKVRFVKYKLPKDIADSLEGTNYDVAYEEVHIVAKRNKVLNFSWLAELKDKLLKGEVLKFAELLPIEKDSDEIKLEFKIDGNRRRTLRLRNEVSFRSDYLLDNLEFGEDEHPTLESIHQRALDLLSIIKSTVFGIEA
jgi:hypothetical protein